MPARDAVPYNLGLHTNYATSLGWVIASWNMIEYYLFGLFTVILHSPPQRAQAAFYSLVNNKARIDMMRAVSADPTIPEKYRTRIQSALDNANEAARARNKYAHYLWTTDGNEIWATELLDTPVFDGQKQKIQWKEMIDAIEKIKASGEEINQLLQDWTQEHPIEWAAEILPRAWPKRLKPQSGDPLQSNDHPQSDE